MSKVTNVQDGQVVSMDYTLIVDGEELDSSKGGQPLDFIQGAGNIIPGLEKELYGMNIGDSKKVVVAPAEGYGEVDSDAYMDVPREQFPDNIPLEVGVELQLRDQSGQPMHARIDEVGETSVRLDFNHPLAGKELHFDVTIAGLRDPTDEERSHGHVHHGHEH